MDALRRLLDEARARVHEVLLGHDESITLLLVALAAKGHVLMEGLPGVGKTTLAKTFAAITGLGFRRIQLTPDLMPADITGHSYYDQKEQRFRIRRGPVFTNLLLADELNRTPPRTQAALLEVMQERQVTIEGTTIEAPDPFMVVATKNPIEVEGVYQLPEAELDRFMVFIQMRYPTREVETAFLTASKNGPPGALELLPRTLQAVQRHIRVHPDVRDYLVDIVRATREHPMIEYGASPRASEHLYHAAKAHAAIHGRPYAVPDDVQDLAHPVLAHRLILNADAEVQGVTAAEVLDGIIKRIPVPVAPVEPRRAPEERAESG
ncbi:MAG: MoxR family ATPase [Euryarchaeota archaeon]|nr:MoxR family ATPase [Euryarchaeota archaeon]